jgi:hypothetical protein
VSRIEPPSLSSAAHYPGWRVANHKIQGALDARVGSRFKCMMIIIGREIRRETETYGRVRGREGVGVGVDVGVGVGCWRRRCAVR